MLIDDVHFLCVPKSRLNLLKRSKSRAYLPSVSSYYIPAKSSFPLPIILLKAHNWCLPDTFYLSSQMFGKVASGKSNFSTQLYIPSKSVNCLCYLRFDCLSRRARVGHLITSATCPNPAVVCTITLLYVKKLNLADKRRWEILKELKCY